jgi:hypothetical protein
MKTYAQLGSKPELQMILKALVDGHFRDAGRNLSSSNQDFILG